MSKIHGDLNKKSRTSSINKLNKLSTHPFYIDFDKYREIAGLCLFPFHTFNNERGHFCEIENKTSEIVKNTLLHLSYDTPGAGGEAFYETELLVCKRKIYDQGANLKRFLDIEIEKELKPFADKHHIKNFEETFLSNLGVVCNVLFTVIGEGNKKTVPSMRFNRFGMGQSFSSENADSATQHHRVMISDFWLQWSRIARRARFDFDYLSTLKPIEMRFYELTSLLNFKDKEKPASKPEKASLEISYENFCQLMPLPFKPTNEEIKNQLQNLCDSLIESQYLNNFEIDSQNDHNTFNSKLKFTFK